MPSDARRLGLILLLALAVRLLVFPTNEHLYGDAVSRTEMAERWAQAPHIITSFDDGAAQYGPLHLYLVGAALSVFDRNDASRLVSLLFGVMTLVPLFALTRHYFGTASATWACLGFSVWGLHIQASTTGGSEAVGLFLLWVSFAWFARVLYRPHWIPLLVSAAALNLAAATRYDAWMYIPLLAAVPVWHWTDRRRGLTLGVAFTALCLPFPIFWMIGNTLAHNDALYPLTYIDAFHRAWAAETPAGWPQWWLRAQGIGFWPATALFTFTPGVALFGMAGMWRAWSTRPATRWLSVAAVIPAAYYAFRTTVMGDFVPLGRFTVVQVSLLLPFVHDGWVWAATRYGTPRARRLAQVSVALAVAMPTALGALTWRNDSRIATLLKPVSPTSTNPRPLIDAAARLRTEAAEIGRTIAFDEDPSYLDLQLAFFARVDKATTLRMRWPDFRERVARSPPDVFVVFDQGRLQREPWVSVARGRLTIGSETWIERPGFEAPIHVFERLTAEPGSP